MAGRVYIYIYIYTYIKTAKIIPVRSRDDARSDPICQQWAISRIYCIGEIVGDENNGRRMGITRE
jgi:hypothetical protein